MIFQDPYGSLNPRRRVGSIIGDPFAIHKTATGQERKRKVQEVMELVGPNPQHFNRFPAEFSGGERQRIGLPGPGPSGPKLIVADEPVSALMSPSRRRSSTCWPTCRPKPAPDLHLHRRARPVGGAACEQQRGGHVPGQGDRARPGRRPLRAHPLTPTPTPGCQTPRFLDPDKAGQRERIILARDVPSPISPPSGCRFHPRCPKAAPACVCKIPCSSRGWATGRITWRPATSPWKTERISPRPSPPFPRETALLSPGCSAAPEPAPREVTSWL